MICIDADGWRRTPVDMRVRVLKAMQRSVTAPFIFGTRWDAIVETERRRVCEGITQYAQSIVRLVADMSADGRAKGGSLTQDDINSAFMCASWAFAAIGRMRRHQSHRSHERIQQSVANAGE